MNLAYVAILVSFGIAGIVVAVLLGAGALLRPRRPSAVKAEAFECGNPPSGPAWGRFSVNSYLTAVDYLGRTPRFEVVYQLYSLSLNHRLRVKVPVPEDDPVVPTASGVWKSANWAEREAWDMFGIRFAGHPDLRRILMYPEFEGHPLRKDYPVDKRQPLVPERDPVRQPWYPRRSGAA